MAIKNTIRADQVKAGSQYGQIGKRIKTGGADMITGRVWIRAEIVRAAK